MESMAEWSHWNFLWLACVAFVQNMAFTWTSRSRNSGNPSYHRYAAWSSNGIWFVCSLFVFKLIWEPLLMGAYWQVAIGGLIYILATTEGSVFMMKLLLGKLNVPLLSNIFLEKKDRQVGAR